jgi:beta-galactosidase
MEAFPNTGHTWAPELFYDRNAKNYIIYWSSDNDLWNIYYTTTKDFTSFSETKILFSNGERGGGKAGNNGPIDAYILEQPRNEYRLFYKKDDNTGVPNIYWRPGKSPLGPWGEEVGPVTPSTGDEGPSIVRVGDRFAMYTDPFESDKAYMFTSKDFRHWNRESTDLAMSHGSVIEIDERTWRRLKDGR